MPKKGDRKWTDEQLRDAVASSTMYIEVMRKLDLSPRGRNHRTIQERIKKLDLDTSHFMVQSRPFTDTQLRELVPTCTSYIMVVERLGIERTDLTATRLQRRIGTLGLSTAHFLRSRKQHGRRRRWSDDQLRAAVVSSHGYSATLRALGLIPAGGNYVQVQRRIRELELDTSHFLGAGWNLEGKYIKPVARSLEQVLVANRWTSSHKLKRRLIREGLMVEACELCGWAERAADGRIPLELDHKNGDRNDNQRENLRILCPNCHSLQPTHRGLNQKRRKASTRGGT